MDRLINLANSIELKIDRDFVSRIHEKIHNGIMHLLVEREREREKERKRESYLALSHQGKEKLIKQYYSDMNSRTSSGKLFVLIFFKNTSKKYN